MHPAALSLLLTAHATGGVVAGFLLGLATLRPRLRRMAVETAAARWLAEHDPLTGLPNRAAARRHFQQDAAAGRAGAVALLDLDGFKLVNDTWGHAVGDALLVTVADRLAAASRDVAARAFRLGGDEFVVLLRPAAAQEALRQVTAIVAKLGVAAPLTTDGTRPVIICPSASAGLAVPGPDETFSDLLRHADLALYQAKHDRAGRHVYTCQPSSTGMGKG